MKKRFLVSAMAVLLTLTMLLSGCNTTMQDAVPTSSQPSSPAVSTPTTLPTVPTESSSVPTVPSVPTEPSSVPTAPSSVPTAPSSVPTAPTDPTVATTPTVPTVPTVPTTPTTPTVPTTPTTPTVPTTPTAPTTPSAPTGTGTQSDPFLIRNLNDLINLKNVLNKSGYYYKQVADIDCTGAGNWIVIGTSEKPFKHHYDGGGYTISNLCLDGKAGGLFSFVENSKFKNIKIVNAHTAYNHTTYANNTALQPGNGGHTGAIVGYGTGCTFENCSATVNFQSSNSPTGGLIGFVELKNQKHDFMKDCHVAGTVTGSGYVGGLVGQIWHYMADGEYTPAGTITIKNCSADVDIKIFTASTESPCVGGLIGEAFGVRIEKCHASGSINVIDGDIGGLVGNAHNYTDIIRCYAGVDIYASTDDPDGGISAGGLIGHIYSRSDVYDCYATGNITVPYARWSPCQGSTLKNGGPWRRYYNPCGSLIGTLEVFRAYSEDEKITVYNCYATGKVNAPNICEDDRVYCHGALIGLTLDRYTMTNVTDKTQKDQSSWDGLSEHYIGHFGNNYNLEDLRTYYSPINDYAGKNLYGLQNPKYTAVPTHDYVQIITEAQLLDQGIFEGWDFVNVWKMTANGPVLR